MDVVKPGSDELLGLIEKAFPCVLTADEEGRVCHASPGFLRECGADASGVVGRDLSDLVVAACAPLLAGALRDVKSGAAQRAKLSFVGEAGGALDLTVTYSAGPGGGFYLLVGSPGNGPAAAEEWEKDERIKELYTVYAVAEWIERSASVREFFEELPKHLCPGMRYPARALIYAAYQGQEYGDKDRLVKYIRSELKVAQSAVGEIRVGYAGTDLDLLAEEQKMLDEIARVLNLALERKSLREKLALVHTYLDRTNRDWEESKTRLETIFEAIPDNVALIDRQHNVVMTNRKNVAAGDKCHRTFFNIDVPCKDCRLSKVMKVKTPVTLEVRHEDTFYEVNALPIFSPEHEVEGIIEFYRDVTVEKTYEQQLQQADKLASLGQLVSGIGHEINNPNQFIRGNVKIIQQALADILPIIDEHYAKHPDLKIARLKYDFFREHIMVLVNDMAHGSERIKEIVEGLKRFARRDEGLLIDSVEVNTIVDAARRLVHNEVHKTADIELELAQAVPAITGNSQKIEQVLVNLMINASQAMPEGRRGRIRVATRLEDGHVVIEVQDNGKGMPERTVKRIFEPFFTTRRATGGTGLGLAIAYRIIEEHGGTIAVTSKLDVGTTFKVSLPLKGPPPPKAPGEALP